MGFETPPGYGCSKSAYNCNIPFGNSAIHSLYGCGVDTSPHAPCLKGLSTLMENIFCHSAVETADTRRGRGREFTQRTRGPTRPLLAQTFKSHVANTKDKIIIVDFYEE